MLDRDQFAVLDDGVYLNTARHAPLPRVALEAARRVLQEQADGGSARWPAWDARNAEVRALGAALLGADGPDDVSFAKNTTELLATVANGLDLGPGDRVVLPADEFPSNRLLWESLRARGVEVELLTAADPAAGVTPEEWAAALARPASVVTTAWVRAADGLRVDLERLAELAHAAGAILAVDAIQGVGVVPASFASWGVDAAGAAAFKWLLGPEGIAFGYLSPRLRARLRPLQPGWYSQLHTSSAGEASAGDASVGEASVGEARVPPALAFTEGGSPNSVGIAALGASAELLLDAGVDAIWQHVEALRARLCTGLAGLGLEEASPVEGPSASGIVLVRSAVTAPEALFDGLQAAGVVASLRSGGVRLSVHGFNDAGDIDLALEALAAAT